MGWTRQLFILLIIDWCLNNILKVFRVWVLPSVVLKFQKSFLQRWRVLRMRLLWVSSSWTSSIISNVRTWRFWWQFRILDLNLLIFIFLIHLIGRIHIFQSFESYIKPLNFDLWHIVFKQTFIFALINQVFNINLLLIQFSILWAYSALLFDL